MGQQDENAKQCDDQPAMDGSGASGEGANSALEAMLKKRREHVHPQVLEPLQSQVHPAPPPDPPAAEPTHGGNSKPSHRPET